ncbi:hypothetical protein [Roseibium aggregatum]|uniref:Uncharacterized protein n=1 Tax=Roseibium aggregatum TaxID=187304 RepID=A0A926P6L9_9HYPH|nr:hypothetical protein [Roseibium aggregatum]MBD1549656.1 hypothetical protein [Roseibium aggregatum]
MLSFEFLRSAYDHALGRPKTALPTRYHYIDVVGHSLAKRGITLTRLGQHAVILKDLQKGKELIVVVRYTTDRDLYLIALRKNTHSARLAYLIDDDYWTMLEDNGLREDYRARLAYFLERYFARLRPMLDAVVAPSQQILARLADFEGVHMEPPHLSPSSDLGHFQDPDQIRIVFLGTSTHGADFRKVAPGIANALKQNPRLHLTTLLGKRGGELIAPGPQVTHLDDMFFPRFQSWLPRQRFHIGLAPYEPNPVNDGRSNLKFHQHALVGAAGLYSRTKPFLECVEDGWSGLLLDYDPRAWGEGISTLATEPNRIRTLAANGADAGRVLGAHDVCAEKWLGLL